MLEVKVLIAYQFDYEEGDRNNVKELMSQTCQQAENDLNQLRQDQVLIRPVVLDMQGGHFSSAELLAKVASCDLCVFEASEVNADILFALGYAVGQGKPCIYLKHQDQEASGSHTDAPGVFTLRYNSQTLVDRLSYEIYRRASEIVDKRIVEREASLAKEEEFGVFRSFWSLERERRVYIVCPEIPESERLPYASFAARDYLRLAKFADIDTLFHLKSFFSRFFPNIRIFEVTANDIPPEANNENLVVVGGVAWNRFTAQVTRSVNLPLIQQDGGPGNPDPIEDIRSETRYSPVVGKDGSVQEDVGYFVRVPNPLNKQRILFVINGVLTYGVLGVARCFTDGVQAIENCSHILNRMGKPPFFAALIRIPVINNYSVIPNITKRGVLMELLGYSPERNEFT